LESRKLKTKSKNAACSETKLIENLNFQGSAFLTMQCFRYPHRTGQIIRNAAFDQNAAFSVEMQRFEIYRTHPKSSFGRFPILKRNIFEVLHFSEMHCY
jgi:hypothetical protein